VELNISDEDLQKVIDILSIDDNDFPITVAWIKHLATCKKCYYDTGCGCCASKYKCNDFTETEKLINGA
jgi:hypothetical protein